MSDREALAAIIDEAVVSYYGTDSESLVTTAVDAVLSRWRLTPVDNGADDTCPPPEKFNAVTNPTDPNPRWHYVDEAQMGSPMVTRYYTYPVT